MNTAKSAPPAASAALPGRPTTSSRTPAIERPSEAKVLAALVVLLLAGEVALRLVENRLSGNLAHIREIPSTITRVANGGVVILGNSLIDNGVSEDVVRRGLAAPVAKVAPDASSYWDWQCLIDRHVVERPDVRLNAIVMGFAWHLLSDLTPPDPSRMGAFYCRFSDLAAPSAIGLNTVGQTGEFLLARSLHIYALRDTLRNRVLSLFVPHYRRFTQEANARSNEVAGLAIRGTRAPTYTYSRFAALVSRLKTRGTQVVVIAMPVQNHYELDPELEAMSRSGTIRLIDFRRVEGIDSSSYRDLMHLNEDGQQILSRKLAARLSAGN